MKLIQTIENKLTDPFLTYVPGEFLPVFEEGRLANRGAFLAYKLHKASQHIGRIANTVSVGVSEAIDQARME